MIDELKELLASWAKVPTWHTSHPLDEDRFNNALAEAMNYSLLNGSKYSNSSRFAST